MDQNVIPGLVVLVSEGGRVRDHEAFGNTGSLEDLGSPVVLDTIYDAASVTKSAVTGTLLMSLVAEEKLSLETYVSPLLPELVGPGKNKIQLRHLLGHASGLPAHKHFFDRIWTGDLAGTDNPRDALVVMAGQTPLEYATGSQTIYSDLGYILLGRLIERVSDTALETLFAERVSGPLAMTDSGFGSQVAEKLARIAPSQRYDDHRGLLHGRVHDDNANSSGGVCGHAGLFTTASDLAKLATVLQTAYLSSSGDSFLPQAVIREFWHSQAAPETSWRMSWDTPSGVPGVSHSGDRWPKTGVGHLGFTGTAWWLAPEQDIFVIILSNRVYCSWEKTGIKRLRRALMDAITGELLPCPRVS